MEQDQRSIVCERCEKNVVEVFECEICEMMICDNCSASYNQFTQIDYTCCKQCARASYEEY